jgi:glycosyltransferase involved in cell wall biosynthesis
MLACLHPYGFVWLELVSMADIQLHPSNSNAKLCIVTYVSLDSRDGKWYTDYRLGAFVDSLATYFAKVTLVGPAFAREQQGSTHTSLQYEYAIMSPNVECVPLEHSSPRTPLSKKILIALKRVPDTFSAIKEADFVYVMFSGYSGFIAHLLCRLLARPYALYFGADWQEVAKFRANWQSTNSLSYKTYVNFSKWAEIFAVRGARFALAHGKKVIDKFKGLNTPVLNTVPMVLVKPHHFFDRQDTCQDQTITCICVGSIIPRKGQHRLIQACHQLVQNSFSIRVMLVGTGDSSYEAKLKEQVTQYGLEQNVEFCGFTDDLETLLSLYRRADIFVLPTSGEGFPRVIYEAMSQGLPVVASKIGTLEAELIDREHAVLASPDSDEALADAIALVIKDASLRRKLIQNGYRFALDRLTNDGTAAQVISLYEQYAS